MLVNKLSQDLHRRPGSADAKKALASFRILLALRSSLFSRSNSFTRCASAVVTPSRTPVSTSTRLTHSLSVCGTQPIFGAMDSMAAHGEGYSPQCSCTMRTARSRTSAENLFDFFIIQSSQRFEPPQKPGRFILCWAVSNQLRRYQSKAGCKLMASPYALQIRSILSNCFVSR